MLHTDCEFGARDLGVLVNANDEVQELGQHGWVLSVLEG